MFEFLASASLIGHTETDRVVMTVDTVTVYGAGKYKYTDMPLFCSCTAALTVL